MARKKKWKVVFLCVVCGKNRNTKDWKGHMWKSYFVCKYCDARIKKGLPVNISDKHAKFLKSIHFPCVLRKTDKKRVSHFKFIK